ncbi:branched-chain amino acid transport system / permease component domain-containing protein [Ditylenchus destructor]|uniref:Branched-chain amino acid transport system / permease component domain-containing protein n=1 Tax=Ditylenchus destructor TaxID=166010 RepID=A0AAD4QRQ3_9BILA|nr:branched-chain amino acid transport system / permease component domain-containing protein [Ditylenchus destructor]
MLGALYALFGLGLSLSLGVMKMINIAHGDLIVLGAYLCSTVMQLLGTGRSSRCSPWSPRCSSSAMGCKGVAQSRGGQGRAFAAAAHVRTLDRPAERAAGGFDLGGGVDRTASARLDGDQRGDLRGHQLADRPSHLGRQARAVADDPGTARLVGVNDRNFFALVTGFVLAVIALASVMYGIRTPFSPTAGPERLLYSFEAVVLGGLGNVWGTFVGGLIIGVAQSSVPRCRRASARSSDTWCSWSRCWRVRKGFSERVRDELARIDGRGPAAQGGQGGSRRGPAGRARRPGRGAVVHELRKPSGSSWRSSPSSAMALAWNLLAGYGGLVVVGHQMFVGVGAYALFALSNRLGINPWIMLPLATAATALFALLSALPMFRLSGAHFAVGTWVLAEMLRILTLNNEWLGAGGGMPLEALASFDRWTRNAGVYWCALVTGVGALVNRAPVLRASWAWR